jgi:hypothetical protein
MRLAYKARHALPAGQRPEPARARQPVVLRAYHTDPLSVVTTDRAAILAYRASCMALLAAHRCPICGTGLHEEWFAKGKGWGMCRSHPDANGAYYINWSYATGQHNLEYQNGACAVAPGPSMWFWERLARYGWLMGCLLPEAEEAS